jgi:flavin-dependent dehydrogenase
MGKRCFDSDVLVVGGGPAGAAAAIICAKMGLRVRILEGNASTVDKPGETLHPGVEAVLAQLGVADRLPAVTGSRHAGIRVRWGDVDRFEAYGQDQEGPWLGYQVSRVDFEAMLLDRAREVGVEVMQPCVVRDCFRSEERTVCVEGSLGMMSARTVINASGRSARFSANLGNDRQRHSPPLVARYGYGTGTNPHLDQSPILTGNRKGWLWQAMVRPGLYQWTRVSLDGSRFAQKWRPDEFQELTPVGEPKGADVTWRLAKNPAQPGWFSVGDAAAVLDPTSANGVLRALLSGIMAGKLISGIQSSVVAEEEAVGVYNEWLANWFFRAANTLQGFYRSLGVAGFSDKIEASAPTLTAVHQQHDLDALLEN